MSERRERINSLARDIENKLPSKSVEYRDIEILSEYLLEGYIEPHENVYVVDKKEIEHLRAQLQEAEAKSKTYSEQWERERATRLDKVEKIEDLSAKLLASNLANEKMRHGLEKYGKHNYLCSYLLPIPDRSIAKPCDCGLDDFLYPPSSGKEVVKGIEEAVEALEWAFDNLDWMELRKEYALGHISSPLKQEDIPIKEALATLRSIIGE